MNAFVSLERFYCGESKDRWTSAIKSIWLVSIFCVVSSFTKEQQYRRFICILSSTSNVHIASDQITTWGWFFMLHLSTFLLLLRLTLTLPSLPAASSSSASSSPSVSSSSSSGSRSSMSQGMMVMMIVMTMVMVMLVMMIYYSQHKNTFCSWIIFLDIKFWWHFNFDFNEIRFGNVNLCHVFAIKYQSYHLHKTLFPMK